ncbi:MAG: DUF4124 domain-containing protein [Betaproteobacteria bacterium]
MRSTALIVALLFAPAAGAAYKCVDERGLTHVGDTPPSGCANVVMYEVTTNGHILRRIEPTPTPEQLRVLEEQQRRKREADKLAAEQKRKDSALLATFASEKEFDTARERNIEPLNGRIRSAQDRIKAVDERLAKIDEELEFYKAGGKRKNSKPVEVPHNLVTEQERLRQEKHTLAGNIAATQKEIQAQRDRFDADKKRWVELKASRAGEAAAKPTTVPVAGK